MPPSLDWIHKWLVYDPVTGVFTWAKTKGHRKAGKIAGTIKKDSGYILLWIDGKQYRAHKVAMYIYTGCWPNEFLDHVDGNKANNAISNLRFATKSQNGFNVGIKATNTSGVKGVSWRADRNKWRAYLRINGSIKHLGYFDDIEFAELVVNEARDKYHGEFARNA